MDWLRAMPPSRIGGLKQKLQSFIENDRVCLFVCLFVCFNISEFVAWKLHQVHYAESSFSSSLFPVSRQVVPKLLYTLVSSSELKKLPVSCPIPRDCHLSWSECGHCFAILKKILGNPNVQALVYSYTRTLICWCVCGFLKSRLLKAL